MSRDVDDLPYSLNPLLAPEQWLGDRVRYAARQLDDCVEINADKLGGVPILKGTRLTVAQLLAEIGEGQSVETVADDFDLDVEIVKKVFSGLAVCLDRSSTR